MEGIHSDLCASLSSALCTLIIVSKIMKICVIKIEHKICLGSRQGKE